MGLTKSSSVHPISSGKAAIDLESPRFVSSGGHDDDYDGYYSRGTRSLSADIVEAIVNDGRIGLSPRAYETAMWCSLACFLLTGLGLLTAGAILLLHA